MDTQVRAPQGQGTISVQVRYLGAHRQYVDGNSPATQSVAALKAVALQFFGLVDGAGQPGAKTYTLSKGTVPVTDLTQTLQQLAEGEHHIKLDLLEQLEQG